MFASSSTCLGIVAEDVRGVELRPEETLPGGGRDGLDALVGDRAHGRDQDGVLVAGVDLDVVVPQVGDDPGVVQRDLEVFVHVPEGRPK